MGFLIVFNKVESQQQKVNNRNFHFWYTKSYISCLTPNKFVNMLT